MGPQNFNASRNTNKLRIVSSWLVVLCFLLGCINIISMSFNMKIIKYNVAYIIICLSLVSSGMKEILQRHGNFQFQHCCHISFHFQKKISMHYNFSGVFCFYSLV